MSALNIKDQIFKCLSSSEDFKTNFKPVHQELLKKNKATLLEKHALFDKEKPLAERGAYLFNSKPQENEKAIAIRYVCLLLEVIKYWNVNGFSVSVTTFTKYIA
mgnify:CR=1 FL=1